jgi:hypothetical protein
MAGMISSNAQASKLSSLSPEALQAKLHLSPQQAGQLQRIVLAGRKVMFSKQSHHMMIEQLQGPGPIAQKLGEGTAGLMALLMQESKNSLPPSLLIPAGMVLLAYAADFLRKSGQKVSDADIGEAINVMTSAILHAGGVDADKLAAIGGGGRLPQAKSGPAAQVSRPVAQVARPGGTA